MEQIANRIAAYISAILIWPIVIALSIIAIVYVLTIGLISIMANAIYLYSINGDVKDIYKQTESYPQAEHDEE